MIFLKEYSLEEILPKIGPDQSPWFVDVDHVTFRVHLNSARLECLRRNQRCVRCGRVGKTFRLETQFISKQELRAARNKSKPICFIENCHWCQAKPERPESKFLPAHLNLYARTRKGKLVLMTQDHIIPVSRGGSSNQENLQTMCTHCNQRKGNSLPNESNNKLLLLRSTMP